MKVSKNAQENNVNGATDFIIVFHSFRVAEAVTGKKKETATSLKKRLWHRYFLWILRNC